MNRRPPIGFLAVLALTVVLLSGCAGRDGDGIPVLFNDSWYFIRQDSANMDHILPGNIPNHKWEEISLPHTAFIEPLTVTGRQWTGICWYRKIYRADRRQRHKHTGLLFDGAMHDAIVYLNGAEIARHTGGYLPFYVDLTRDLQYGKENEILVRLDNRENPHIPPGKPLDQLGFLWYSGLYRNVSLYVTDKLHITAPPESNSVTGGGIITGSRDISREAATITVSVEVRNDDNIPHSFWLKNTLLDAAGLETASSRSGLTELEPGQSIRLMTKMIVMHPALWSPGKPFLYTLVTELLSERGVTDRRETRTGIRTVSITPEQGLLINNEPVTVTGTNRHQEYPYIGYALSDNASYRDAFKIQEAGFNLVRCSHYPPSPAFLDACDELGLMVIDAIPGGQFMGDSIFREASIRDTRMMCRRDRNHPSVIMWEASLNETVMPPDFLTALQQTVREELPYGNNYTCSWMDDVCDVFMPARHHASAPDYWKGYSRQKPIFIAEYGSREYHTGDAGFGQACGGDAGSEETSSPQAGNMGEPAMMQQAFNFQEAHNDNLYGPCFGDANWLMYDYNRGCAPDIETSGVMDIFRIPKYAYWFYRSQAEEGPLCFIAHHNLPTSGTTVRVYSNADTVRLFQNDSLIAVQAPDNDRNSVNLKHPPFTFTLPGYLPGTIRASASRNGAEIASRSVTTPGSPAALRLTADFSNKPLQADGADVVFVYASLVDSTDNPVYDSGLPVEFSVRGDAELVGDNPVMTEAGIASILLRAGTHSGRVMVRAAAEGVAMAEIMTDIK